MLNGDRNENELGPDYAKGYNHGFWTGCIISFLCTVGLLYLIGIYG